LVWHDSTCRISCRHEELSTRPKARCKAPEFEDSKLGITLLRQRMSMGLSGPAGPNEDPRGVHLLLAAHTLFEWPKLDSLDGDGSATLEP
jgi:hypothetical protein